VAEPHLDHPGDFHWFSGYGPSLVVGPCPHGDCKHWGKSVIAWGPDYQRYELVTCDDDEGCNGYCRAWSDGQGRISSPWLQVEWSEREVASDDRVS
jgi:hypothetical protein